MGYPVRIISRAQWGAQPWRPNVEMYRKTIAEQVAFFIHYHGHPPQADRGPAMAREVETIHLANGWAGVGYSWLIGQDGIPYEGRGWDLVTAACPSWNRNSWHAYIAVGDNQEATAAALHTVRALYDLACRRSGKVLAMTWHSAHYPTECPGPDLRAWVQAGMPTTDGGEPMLTEEDIGRILDAAARHQPLLAAIADELLSSAQGAAGARYKSRDGVDPDTGQPVLLGLTDVGTRTLALLRGVDAKLDELLESGRTS